MAGTLLLSEIEIGGYMAEWRSNIIRQTPGNKACVMFIHGFNGDPTATWARFPDLLEKEPSMRSWDIVCFGYESSLLPDLTGIWRGNPPIKTIADSLRTFTRLGLASQYQALIFIAHSMGGLAVQRALLDDKEFTEKVCKVILFGTPSFGLVKAWPFQRPILKQLFRQARDMGKTSRFIKSLRSDWNERFGDSPPFAFLAVAGSEDEFVTQTASIEGFPDNLYAVVPGNHFGIVKPSNATDASVVLVINFIHGKYVFRGYCDTASLHLERREFQQVVNQLGPNRTKLDSHALVDLALALDGLGKRDEAINVIADAKQHGTDAMGVLAGRHKRNWIQYRKDHDAHSALDLYREAYEIAIKQGDEPAQAYYPGINLAFFALVYEVDLAKAKNLAQQVLGHCAQAKRNELNELPDDRMWRLATEGEANLILCHTDRALNCYKSALAGPSKPKPWQFTSTYQQALLIADTFVNEETAKSLLSLFTGGQS